MGIGHCENPSVRPGFASFRGINGELLSLTPLISMGIIGAIGGSLKGVGRRSTMADSAWGKKRYAAVTEDVSCEAVENKAVAGAACLITKKGQGLKPSRFGTTRMRAPLLPRPQDSRTK
jgi:hypothetical protein